MTEPKAPVPPTRLGLVVARRAMVVSVGALLVAIATMAVVLLGDSDSDTGKSAAPGQAQADAAAARAEAEQAAAMADDAVAIAEAAAAKAAAAEEALAAALAAADGAMAPDVVARLEAQLQQAQADAAAALAAAAAVAIAQEAPAAGTTPEDPDAAGDASEPDGTAAAGDASEPDGTDAAVPLPGEPYEFGPSAGAGLAVVGVVYDSALNVRDVPNGEIIARLDNVMDGARDPVLIVRDAGSDDIVATLDLRQGAVATGNARKLPTTIWHEVRIGDLVGWASGAYLAPLGADRDATAEVVEALGETPTADTLSDIGLLVSGVFASSGEVQSRTTVSSRPGVFEAVGDITLDVLGLPDDAVRGYRVNVAADAGAEDWTQDNPGPFTLRSVSVTPICDTHRGVSEEGLCN